MSVQWRRAQLIGGRTVHKSKCGRYEITRREWVMPFASVSYRLAGSALGGKRGYHETDTLREAKEAAQDDANEREQQTVGS